MTKAKTAEEARPMRTFRPGAWIDLTALQLRSMAHSLDWLEKDPARFRRAQFFAYAVEQLIDAKRPRVPISKARLASALPEGHEHIARRGEPARACLGEWAAYNLADYAQKNGIRAALDFEEGPGIAARVAYAERKAHGRKLKAIGDPRWRSKNQDRRQPIPPAATRIRRTHTRPRRQNPILPSDPVVSALRGNPKAAMKNYPLSPEEIDQLKATGAQGFFCIAQCVSLAIADMGRLCSPVAAERLAAKHGILITGSPLSVAMQAELLDPARPRFKGRQDLATHLRHAYKLRITTRDLDRMIAYLSKEGFEFA